VPVSKNGNTYFTDEQYNIARYESSALEYARSRGYDLIKKGKYYTLREHDSMVFTERGGWFWNSHNISGGAIEFMTHYEHKPLTEAVLALAGENVLARQSAPAYAPAPANSSAPGDAFQLPERNGNHKRVFAYLTKTRGIDAGLVSQLLQEKKIYETAQHHNAALVCQDNAGNVTGAFLRGTNTNMKKPFKGMAAGSDKSSSCFYFGGGKEAAVACVFEASIDAMSYATLQARAGNTDLSQRYYIASGGAGDGNILAFLSGHPNIQKVVLCHDNDAAGHKMAEDLKTKLQPLGYQVSRSISRGKDFNEDLCNMIRQEQQELEVTAEPDGLEPQFFSSV